jgi:hypothetical protein
VLPIDRRDELAELLTDRDIETLRHLVDRAGVTIPFGRDLRSRLS